jgi:hypothetical protein
VELRGEARVHAVNGDGTLRNTDGGNDYLLLGGSRPGRCCVKRILSNEGGRLGGWMARHGELNERYSTHTRSHMHTLTYVHTCIHICTHSLR